MPATNSGDLKIGEDAIDTTNIVAGIPLRFRHRVQIGDIAPRHCQHLMMAEYVMDQEVADRMLRQRVRSEEHTSELQSLMRISYAVFCLKKKKIQKIIIPPDKHK